MKKAFILLGLIPAIATAALAERDQKLFDQIERAAHEKTEGGRRQDCPFERIRLLTELQHNRMNAVARCRLGVIYRDFYDFKNEALREFELFVRLSSNSDPEYAKVVRKVIPDLRAKIARSAEERLNANSRNPIKASALLAEGSALEAKHDAVSAMKKYEAALVEDPLADLAALAIARLKGRNARSEKDVYGVLAMYRMAIDLNPSKQASYREAATFAYQHQRWNSTVAILDRALANFPASGEFLDMMIAALTKLEHIELAEAWRRFRLSIAAAGGGKNAQQSTDKILISNTEEGKVS